MQRASFHNKRRQSRVLRQATQGLFRRLPSPEPCCEPLEPRQLLSAPDLIISSGTPMLAPELAVAGGTVALSSWTIKNQGDAAAGAFANGFYLSKDAVITSADTYLGGNSNAGLAAGASTTWGGPALTIPASTPAGTYYLGILVDRAGAVAESSEFNNYVAAPITILGAADLVVSSGTPTASPTSVVAGRITTFSAWTVKNQGNIACGGFYNGYYLSKDAVITTSDTYLGGYSNTGLAAGGSYTYGAAALLIPPSTPAGTYYIGVLADRTNTVAESNGANNYASTPMKMTACRVPNSFE